ncbi:MAG TPA: FHA domain-containing protein [Planctomycetota bacterium]|nr:FHA domain-containing protein [Planctomycetota bacterium]
MASVTVIFGGQEQKVFELDKPKMVVGREPSCEIHIDNLGISRNHCAFINRNDSFVLQDLGSSNGTYVNGRKITEYFLNDADEVIIGKYTLRFKNEAQAAAAAPKTPSQEAGVPDTLNTYVMDGAKIQEQLAKMRSGQTAGPANPIAPPAGATARDYAKALDPGAAPEAASAETAKMKTLVIALASVVVVLLIGFVVLLLMMKK